MFKELAPYLRQRAVLLTVTHIEEDQIRVNVIPQKIKDGENSALTTPLSVTGTAEELDNELPSSLVSFVSAHLQLKNTLEKAQAEMDAAAKAAKAEATAKKTPGKKEVPRTDTNAKLEAVKPVEPVKPEPARTASLFDMPETVTLPPTGVTQSSVEAEILAELNEDSAEQEEDWDEAV
jgi:PRTRC genetic system protein E